MSFGLLLGCKSAVAMVISLVSWALLGCCWSVAKSLLGISHGSLGGHKAIAKVIWMFVCFLLQYYAVSRVFWVVTRALLNSC